jgi:hypothetical protein
MRAIMTATMFKTIDVIALYIDRCLEKGRGRDYEIMEYLFPDLMSIEPVDEELVRDYAKQAIRDQLPGVTGLIDAWTQNGNWKNGTPIIKKELDNFRYFITKQFPDELCLVGPLRKDLSLK